VWERIKKAILKHPQTRFKAKREKGVGKPFSRVSAPLHPLLTDFQENNKCNCCFFRISNNIQVKYFSLDDR